VKYWYSWKILKTLGQAKRHGSVNYLHLNSISKNVQIYNSCFAGNYKQIYAKENDSTKYLNNVVDILDRTGVSLPYS
jgi:hypothetical protein